jgi:hypothetical protein
MKPYDDPEQIRSLYHGTDMTIAEVADEMETSAATLYRRMEKFGITRKKSGVSAEVRKRPPKLSLDNQGYEVFVSHTDGEQDRLLHHRLLAVAEFGFDLVADNHVHHQNGIKWDNRPGNLEVLQQNDHLSLHAEEQRRDPLGRFN